jgi:hypothetical protein
MEVEIVGMRIDNECDKRIEMDEEILANDIVSLE